MTTSPYPWGSRGRSAAISASLLAVGLASVALKRRQPLFRVVVEGPSMLPELAPGDRLIALRSPVLEPGDIVAVTDPAQPGRILVKRVAGLRAETIEIAGDNAGVSRDSRHFGPVSRRQVLGRVIYRYQPPDAVRSFWRRGRSPARADTMTGAAGLRTSRPGADGME